MNSKLYTIFLLLLSTIMSFAQSHESIKKVREKQLNLQNKTESLDFKRMETELKEQSKDESPFTYGVFPYPIYDSIQKDGFKGVGTSGNFFGLKLQDKRIVFTSFIEKNWGNINSHKVKGKDRVFFSVLVLTDFIDDKKYSSSKMHIVSRNFPDVIGQGFVKTSLHKIDFSAFTTPEGDDFAIINMKLYHLKYGNIILIAPQKDGSLRSMQLKNEADLSTETINPFLQELIKKPEITAFFINKDSI
ncbi:hypothetical protein [Chryseobacterium sp. JK1]|uniref:hypothetical protein n=1 Tax=Chryseobacterium sp. JK1 TaxID=874294 RepID=UPI003D687531